MKILFGVIYIIGFIISAGIVNVAQRLFMKLMGADTMFFSMKTKIIIIFFVNGIILSFLAIVLEFFGILSLLQNL